MLMVGVCLPLCTFGQQLSEFDNPTLTKTIPPSPEAASLGKYGEIPVSNYTGIPNISVPLHTAQSGDISLPISLNYHAGGIKVEETASWVGLGWSLNAGGVVTRTVRGLADELGDQFGYGNYKENLAALGGMSEGDKVDLFSAVENGFTDLEPDLYSFNFAGYSGQFYMDEDPSNPGVLVPVLKPKKGLKIEYVKSTDQITRWVITTENGSKFVFGNSLDGTRSGIERNTNTSYCSDNSGVNLNPGNTTTINGSWFLVEVLSVNGFRIDLFYDDHTYNYRTFGSETAYLLVPGTPIYGSDPEVCQDRINHCYVRNEMAGKRLRQIVYNNGSIDFLTRNDFRADMCQNKALKTIQINGPSGIIKSYELQHGYFQSPGSSTPTHLPDDSCLNSDGGVYYRLKLESVSEIGKDGSSKPPHSFAYNETYNLPARLNHDGVSYVPTAYGQDHWGYYNGITDNRRDGTGPYTLLPTSFDDYPGPTGTQLYQFDGADRTSNGTYAQANTLESITYPTGGVTTFEYESNDITSDQIPVDLTLNYTPKVAGPYNYASDQNGDPAATFTPFTINSQFELNGTAGAYVETLFYERAQAAGECGDGTFFSQNEWVVDRWIYNADTNAEVYSNDSQNGEQIFLPNGNYYVKLQRKNIGVTCHSEFTLTLKWREADNGVGITNVLAGGLRIKKIVSSDGIGDVNDQVMRFEYHRFDDPTLTSGFMTNFPVYGWKFFREWHVNYAVSNQNFWFVCPYFIKQSFSLYPLATTGGGVVGYKNVTVYSGATSEAGKTEYTYTTVEDFPDEKFLLAPSNELDWRRGLLKKQSIYKQDGANYQLVQDETYDHTRQDPEVTFGLKLTKREKQVNGSLSSDWLQTTYTTSTEFQYQSFQLTRKNISIDQANWFEEANLTTYSGEHFQISQTQKNTSEGETIISNFVYPGDIHAINPIPTNPTDVDGQALRALIDRHQLNFLVEKQVILDDGTSQELITAGLQTYSVTPQGPVKPDNYYIIENDVPLSDLAKVGYTPNVGLDFNSAYELRTKFSSYDNYGNLQEYTSPEGITSVFIWGYNGELIAARVDHATKSQIESLGVNLNLGNGGLTDSQRSIIREGLPDAVMTSYIHDPGIGIKSIIDPNGIRSYYQYDEFNRLERIVDHEGNVLKQFEYNYAND